MMTEHRLPYQQRITVYSLFVLYYLLTGGPMSGYELAHLIKKRSHGALGRPLATHIHVFMNSKRRVTWKQVSRPEAAKRLFIQSLSKENRPFEVVRSNNGNESKTC
jgi:hypothetical protein